MPSISEMESFSLKPLSPTKCLSLPDPTQAIAVREAWKHRHLHWQLDLVRCGVEDFTTFFFLPSTQGLPLVVKLPCEKLFICPVVESGIWQQMCLRCLARMFTGSLCGLFTPCGLGLTQREEKWVEIFCCHSKTAFFDHTARQIPRWLAYSFSDQKWSVGIQQEMKWCKLILLARLSFTHVAQSDVQRLIF